MWVQVFNLHFFDKMEILSPQETPASDPQLVPSQGNVNCGCKVSHVGASFPMWVRVFNLHFFDKMKILSPQETPASDPQLVPSQGF